MSTTLNREKPFSTIMGKSQPPNLRFRQDGKMFAADGKQIDANGKYVTEAPKPAAVDEDTAPKRRGRKSKAETETPETPEVDVEAELAKAAENLNAESADDLL